MFEGRKSAKPTPMRFRAIGPVIRAAGLVPWAIVFAGLFVVASVVVSVSEPAIGGFANSAWLMFQVVTPIGLGDFTCTSLVGGTQFPAAPANAFEDEGHPPYVAKQPRMRERKLVGRCPSAVVLAAATCTYRRLWLFGHNGLTFLP